MLQRTSLTDPKSQTMKMEMLSAQWLSALGMEDPALLRQYSNLSNPTLEQLAASMDYQHNENFDQGGSFQSFNPMENLKIPSTACSEFHSGVRFSEGLTGYERPMKIPKANSWDSTSSQFPFSSVYLQNSMQNVQVQQQHCLPQQLESYITSIPQVKDDIYETVAPRTPAIQGEIMVSKGSAGQKSCISNSDINRGLDAFNLSAGEELISTQNIFMGNHFLDANVSTSIMNPPVPAKTSGHSQDHIMAERKRRERLSQRFIALSALIPGLKKMDKASVLDDAIKYVKKLRERLNLLEQQTPKDTVQSVVYVNKSPLSSEDDKTSSIENSSKASVDDKFGLLTPEIEARVVGRNVLVRIHCEKKKGLLVKCLSELEKLQLTVANASILSFSETALDLTLSAQMEEGCGLTVTDIVKNLEAFFKKMS
jgi:hypothetical protein